MPRRRAHISPGRHRRLLEQPEQLAAKLRFRPVASAVLGQAQVDIVGERIELLAVPTRPADEPSVEVGEAVHTK